MAVTSILLCCWVGTSAICLERAIKRSTELVLARLRIEELESQIGVCREGWKTGKDGAA
jgi:hypothetical protein